MEALLAMVVEASVGLGAVFGHGHGRVTGIAVDDVGHAVVVQIGTADIVSELGLNARGAGRLEGVWILPLVQLVGIIVLVAEQVAVRVDVGALRASIAESPSESAGLRGSTTSV